MLHSLYLFKNVKITPDYSVVHDLTPENWKKYLIGDDETEAYGDLVWSGDVNYYRLPDVIRIEGNYDDLRKATYGMICTNESADPEEMVIHSSMQRPMFFWVSDVRLVKQGCRVDLQSESRPWEKDYFDVVELSISVDVWSSNNGDFTLYDSYVERRHMPRWRSITQAGVTRHEPIYYPNAAQGIEGAYQKESSEDLTAPLSLEAGGNPYPGTFDPRFIIVYAIKSSGESKIFIGMDVLHSRDGFVPVYHTYPNIEIFGIEEILDGTFYTEAGITAENVQSITVTPVITGIKEAIRLNFAGGVFYLNINDNWPSFHTYFSLGHSTNIGWITLNFGVSRIWGMMLPQYCNPDVIEPDYDTPTYGEYVEAHEPMMYMSPARIRKVVTGSGGEVFNIPDIAAFKSTFTIQNLFDMNGAVSYVFAGSDILEANSIGAMGAIEAATLPVYNSAWKSYEAINKVGDEIAFNAKQMQTIGGGLIGTGTAAVGGFVQGGPVGGILGVIGGATGTILGAAGNEEELRAKRVTIKNSPCVVKSGGSGLGAYVKGLTDIFYITLRIDDKSLEKLRFMYYWYGYHVNRVFRGTVVMHTRKNFDFIKTNGAKVKGDLTAGAAREIGAIFDKGVTIYHGASGYDMIGDGMMHENDEV